MPYSGPNDKNLPSNVQDMPDNDRKQWVDVFNSAYASCTKDGGSNCEGTAMKEANGVVKKKKKQNMESLVSSLQAIQRAISDFFKAPQEHSLSLPTVYSQVQMAAGYDAWLIDVYLGDTGSMFAIFAVEGNLFKSELTFDYATNQVTVPPQEKWIKVMEEFTPVKQDRLKISRQKDGSTRWFLIAGTTVLNRNAQIDSYSLFDDFVSQAENEGKYPYLTFFHLKERFRMGKCDYLARDECLLIASGLFDDGKVAQAMIKAYAADPVYWGSSVSFWVNQYSQDQIAKDVVVPVFKAGSLEEISILPEVCACSIETALRSTKEVSRMKDKRIEDAIAKLAGGDENLAKEFIAMADEANELIESSGKVHRSTDAGGAGTADKEGITEVAPDVTPEVTPEAEVTPDASGSPVAPVAPVAQSVQDKPQEPAKIELDEEALRAISDVVMASPAMQNASKATQDALASLTAKIDSITEAMQSFQSSQEKLESRLLVAEKADSEKQKEWLNNQSKNVSRLVQVSLRPRNPDPNVPKEQSGKVSMAEIAEATLSNLK